ncbi:MAG: sugar-transfer associated ATP-grasp domain-containing protein [Candidatus Krumholzibacteriia bacterium]
MHAASRFAVGLPVRWPLLKLLERAYRWQYPRRSKRQRQAMARYHGCPDRKDPRRVRRELRLLARHWGCYPFHYFRYDLFREGRDLDDRALLAYIPEFFLYHVFLPPQEGAGDPAILADKLRTVDLFSARGIAQPAVLGTVVDGRWRGPAGAAADPQALLAAWSEQAPPRVFLKPAAGSGGHGIIVLRPGDGGWRRSSGEPVTAADLARLAGAGRWLVQAGVVQVAETARYYPGSVNTFRINTTVEAGQAKLRCAVIRIGGGGRELDNAALGGIMLGVDSASGLTTAQAGNELMQSFAQHPDSGHRFAADALAVWPEVRAFALRAAAALPEYTNVAWDIAATAAGPLALEANLGFGIDCYQSVLGGLAAAFEIDDPAPYWGAGRRRPATMSS